MSRSAPLVRTVPARTRSKSRFRGLHVYDPAVQEIRSGTTGDIACWYIDTDYNGELLRSARQKLKRALRAEID